MKELLKTKTFWTGIGLVSYGVVLLANNNTDEGIKAILEGLAVIFLRDAIRKR